MKISTVPFLPLSEASVWSLPFVSGRVNSSIVAPIGGGIGKSGRTGCALKAVAITNTAARLSENANSFFMIGNSCRNDERGNGNERLPAANERWQERSLVSAQRDDDESGQY